MWFAEKSCEKSRVRKKFVPFVKFHQCSAQLVDFSAKKVGELFSSFALKRFSKFQSHPSSRNFRIFVSTKCSHFNVRILLELKQQDDKRYNLLSTTEIKHMQQTESADLVNWRVCFSSNFPLILLMHFHDC